MKLVKYGCGCIGIEFGDEEGNERHVISACDGEWTDDKYSFSSEYKKVINNENITKAVILDSETSKAITEELFKLVQDGYRFRDIQNILKDGK